MTPNDETMLRELLADESDAMTAWEVEFIDSLLKKRLYKWSEKQIETLEKIWNKVFGGG